MKVKNIHKTNSIFIPIFSTQNIAKSVSYYIIKKKLKRKSLLIPYLQSVMTLANGLRNTYIPD